MRCLNRLRLALAFMLGFLVSTTLQAQEVGVPEARSGKTPQHQFTAWNGSFRHSIAIDVPKFRGLEPDLSLSYDSSRGLRGLTQPGGNLGVGWSMTGLSYIERTSGSWPPAAGEDKAVSGKGVPAYGAANLPSDSFMLDGDELIPCTEFQNPASTASCFVPVAAGQVGYATRLENYVRIRNNTVDNTWQVTSKDGVVSTFNSFETAGAPLTFRWYLVSRIDRRGNKMIYKWTCAVDFDCTISSINGINQGTTVASTEVAFYAGVRPENAPYSSGKDLRNAATRIDTIGISSAGSLVRAYKLDYALSPATGLSRLLSVTEFGRDAIITNGVVTAGTALPATSLTYAERANTFTTGHMPAAGYNFAGSQWLSPAFADFTGDGRLDFMTLKLNGCGGHGTMNYFHNNGDSFSLEGIDSNNNVWSIGDFAGNQEATRINVDGNGHGCPPYNIKHRLHGDFNGDGKLDILFANGVIWKGGSSADVLQTAVVYVAPDNSSPDYNNRWSVADFNGDGKTDVIIQNIVNNTWRGSVFLGTEAGFKVLPVQTMAWTKNFGTSGWVVADANGDGLSDVIVVENDAVLTTAYKVSTFKFDGEKLDLSNPLVQSIEGLPSTVSGQFMGRYAFEFVAENSGGSVNGLTAQTCTMPTNTWGGSSLSGLSGNQSTAANSTQYCTCRNTVTCTRSDVSCPNWADTTQICTALGYYKLVSPPAFHAGDFNGDKKIDLLLMTTGTIDPVTGGIRTTSTATGTYRMALSDGDGFAAVTIPVPMTDSIEYPYNIVDINSDGKDDLYNGKSTSNLAHLGAGQPDVLISVKTPLGGKLSVSYVSSAEAENTKLPFVMQLVSSLTTNDGRGNVATTDFTYEGGRWNMAEKQFLGFQKVTAILPANDNEATAPKPRRCISRPSAVSARSVRCGSLTAAVLCWPRRWRVSPLTRMCLSLASTPPPSPKPMRARRSRPPKPPALSTFMAM